MQASLSTVMMAVLTTNAFLIILVLCLTNKKLLIHVGHRLLALFVLFTALRFIFPIEFPFTIPIKLPHGLSRIMKHCYTRLFLINGQPFSLWDIFKVIWLVGFLIGLIVHIISYYRASRYLILYGKELTNTDPYKKLLNEICQSKGKANCFRVIELPGLDIPAIFGIIHPRILIPENFIQSEKQLQYILHHETSHHFNHDLLLKNMIKLITLVYWWDIFSWLLNYQTDVILEMRIDNTLIKVDSNATEEYLQCLIDIAEQGSGKKNISGSLTLGFLPSGLKDLKRRFHLMTNNQAPLPVYWKLCPIFVTFLFYLLSYTVILEGYIPPQEHIASDYTHPEDYETDDYIFPTSDNSYFIDNGDGTYDYYINNRRLDTVSSLQYYPDNTPIYTKDTVPQ